MDWTIINGKGILITVREGSVGGRKRKGRKTLPGPRQNEETMIKKLKCFNKSGNIFPEYNTSFSIFLKQRNFK